MVKLYPVWHGCCFEITYQGIQICDKNYEKKVVKLISLFVRLTFWNIGYIYQIGKATTGDRLGVRSLLEFEYNP